MSIRALVLSDIHGSTKAAKLANRHASDLEPDLTIICGDITHFGTREWAVNFLNRLSTDVIGVTGNCDPLEIVKAYQDAGGIHLHLSSYSTDGISFSGLSGYDHPKNETDKFREVSKGSQVFVLHVPPYGINDVTRGGKNIGEKKLNPIIEENKPLLVLSGHVHESAGIITEKGITYINPGPATKGNAAFIELTKEKIINAKLL